MTVGLFKLMQALNVIKSVHYYTHSMHAKYLYAHHARTVLNAEKTWVCARGSFYKYLRKNGNLSDLWSRAGSTFLSCEGRRIHARECIEYIPRVLLPSTFVIGINSIPASSMGNVRRERKRESPWTFPCSLRELGSRLKGKTRKCDAYNARIANRSGENGEITVEEISAKDRREGGKGGFCKCADGIQWKFYPARD